MRDSDCDLASVVVVRADSPIRDIRDLKGRLVAVGAADSPQATLIPLAHLASCGLKPDMDFQTQCYDLLTGKHGDHIGGEREAAKALMARRTDAACMIERNYGLFISEGTLPNRATRILTRTPKFDHCNFTITATAPPARIEKSYALLMAMSYDDPEIRPLDGDGRIESVEARTHRGLSHPGTRRGRIQILFARWRDHERGLPVRDEGMLRGMKHEKFILHQIAP